MERFFEINTFKNGINEFTTDALLDPSEAVYAKNCIIDNGSLTTEREPDILAYIKYATRDIDRIILFHTESETLKLAQVQDKLYKFDGTLFCTIPFSLPIDYVNFQYNGENVLICCCGGTPFIIYKNGTTKSLLNRRLEYDTDGSIKYYVTPEGYKHTKEKSVQSTAPPGNLLELYQDRLWIANSPGTTNSDRIYFSTSGVNGADINDFTTPIEEGEANMHGGFIDIRSYDGSGIIGLKAAFDSLVVFKKKTIYKIVGYSPDTFQVVQVAGSSGTIADKSIAVGNNGIYYLSENGIYFYDGTNTHLISKKIQKTLSKLEYLKLKKVCGCFFNNKYYLAIPINYNSDATRVIEYDTINDSFMIHDYLGSGVTDLKVIDNNLAMASGKFIQDINGTSDSFVMSTVWETGFYDFGSQNSKKNTTYIYFRAKGSYKNSKIKFTLESDRKSKSIEVPLTNENIIYKKKLKNKGRYFKLIIENPYNSYFELSKVQLIAEVDID